MPPRKASPLKGKPKLKPKAHAPKLPPEDELEKIIPPRRKRTKTEDKPVKETVKAEVVVKANGTDTGNTIGQPIFVEPVSPHAVLNNLVCRELTSPSGPLEPLSTTVTTLQDMVNAMSKGTDIAPFKDHIQRVAANQPEKADVIRAYVNQIEHEMIADLTVMRANSMRAIKRASTRNDLSVSEALVVWRMCNDQLPDLKKGLGEDKAVDTVTVVEKIDYRQQQAERITHQQWEGTTPQGRELIRKKLWEVKKEVLAKQALAEAAAEKPAKDATKSS